MTRPLQNTIIGFGAAAALFVVLWLAWPALSGRKLPPPQVLQDKIVKSEPATPASQPGNKPPTDVPGQSLGNAHRPSTHPVNPGGEELGADQQSGWSAPIDEEARQAARGLLQHGKDARGVAGKTLEQYRGNDPEVLIPLIQATAKAGDWESIPRLVELMEHPDVRVRGKAGAAVRIIMGADYGFRAEDPPHKRREAIRLINQIYPTMKKKLEQHYGSAPAQ